MILGAVFGSNRLALEVTIQLGKVQIEIFVLLETQLEWFKGLQK